jgi:gluconolactonase
MNFHQLATGFEFLEGPVWDPVGQSVIFSDILGNSIFKWSESGGVQTMRKNSYMANGNAYDQSGRLITCEHATSRITRTDFRTQDELEILADEYQGKKLNSPNDVVVKRDGSIYFTDPLSGRSEDWGIPREPELSYCGVYRLDPDTKELTLLTEDFPKPNGLCFSKDENLLFVNDSEKQHIRVYDATEDGRIERGRLFAALEIFGPGVADGMKIDQMGNVFTCGPGGIHVISPDGNFNYLIETPEFAANFCFGGGDGKSLFVTATTSLYRIRVDIPGHLTYQG